MITFELNVSKLQREKRTIISRNLKAIDSYSFTSDLFDKFFDFPYSHDKVDSYYQFTRSTLDTHAPEKERTVTARLSAPWMTDELKDGKRERRNAERRWRKSGLTIHRQIFSDMTLKVKGLFVSTIRSYNLKNISNSTSSKCLFDIVNKMSGKIKSTINIGLSNAKESAEKFSSFFIEKITKIRENLDICRTSVPSHYEFNGTKFSSFDFVSRDEIKEIIKSSPQKSCMLDPIPTP